MGSKEGCQGFSRCSGERANAGGSKIQASCLLSAFIVCVLAGEMPGLSLVLGVGRHHSRAYCRRMKQYDETTTSGAAF